MLDLKEHYYRFDSLSIVLEFRRLASHPHYHLQLG